uniref:BEACH-type PH domain-containing protein n=1 Tax=Macrostomum lignano TaxID=282301 RepID=A0A1I8G091_9PLAT
SRILATRLELLLDDLLWVLTVSQLEATVLFVKSLQSCIEKATAKQQAASRGAAVGDIKHRPQGHTRSSSSVAAATSNAASATHSAAGNPEVDIDTLGPAERIFRKYDVSETSYHVHTGRVDLHFCEDSNADTKLSANSVANGAIQLTLLRFGVDFYPLHQLDSDRAKNWPNFTNIHSKAYRWQRERINLFKQRQRQHPQQQHLPQLCESAILLRLQDRANLAEQRKPATFLGTDKRRHQLPASSLSVYIDYTQYYYPSSALNTTAAVG